LLAEEANIWQIIGDTVPEAQAHKSQNLKILVEKKQ